jgi:signal recognition particle subunit SRP54
MAFESLKQRFAQIINNIKGTTRLTESAVDDILSQIKVALLDADVSLSVVKPLLEKIKQEAVGQGLFGQLNASETIIKIVRDNLIAILGNEKEDIKLNANKLTTIMMVGLQGSGKTTTAAKLAKLFTDKFNKRVLLVAADIYRPAAIEQLKTLANQTQVDIIYPEDGINVVQFIENLKTKLKQTDYESVIIDTAGRLTIDEKMMDELKMIKQSLVVDETLLVVDAMSGQSASEVAISFNQQIKVTGLIISKFDSDTRGGAALSIVKLTGLPIKMVGTGEKIDDLELFYPDRMVDRILGMGDLASLFEKAQQNIDEENAKKLASRMKSGQFDLNDMLMQMRQIKKLGSLSGLLKMLPGMMKITPEQQEAAERELANFEVIYNSMTIEERANPDILRNSRKLRISKGSGKSTSDINRILKKHEQTKQMMKMINQQGKGGFLNFPGL